jgi:PHD/YefM family antitoxin component YafN of YafNO toxin-antitoxin module
MIALNVQIIKKNGKKEFVLLPYEEFVNIQEQLEDYEDLRCLREAKAAEADAPTIGLDELKARLRRRPKRSNRRKELRR